MKEGVRVFLFFSLLLVLSFSFVSAGFFDKLITGKSIDEGQFCSDGCLADLGRCYGFGDVYDGKYCDGVSGQFVPLSINGEKCNNDFECFSNFCIDSECRSQSFLEKIKVWFKSLFQKKEEKLKTCIELGGDGCSDSISEGELRIKDHSAGWQYCKSISEKYDNCVKCDEGYSWDKDKKDCLKEFVCPSQYSLNKNTNKCEFKGVSNKNCNSEGYYNLAEGDTLRIGDYSYRIYSIDPANYKVRFSVQGPNSNSWVPTSTLSVNLFGPTNYYYEKLNKKIFMPESELSKSFGISLIGMVPAKDGRKAFVVMEPIGDVVKNECKRTSPKCGDGYSLNKNTNKCELIKKVSDSKTGCSSAGLCTLFSGETLEVDSISYNFEVVDFAGSSVRFILKGPYKDFSVTAPIVSVGESVNLPDYEKGVLLGEDSNEPLLGIKLISLTKGVGDKKTKVVFDILDADDFYYDQQDDDYL